MSHESILLDHLFGQSDIGAVAEEHLADLISRYPYFAHARWFKALKSNDEKTDLPLAGVFTMRPLRLMQFLQRPVFGHNINTVDKNGQEKKVPDQFTNSSPEHEEKAVEEREKEEKAPSKENAEPPPGFSPSPLIQPLYTSDYFAYTGAKIPDHIEDGKRPTMEQLHSFTGWLRTLKKSRGAPDPDLESDDASLAARSENEDVDVRKNAADSVTAAEEVLTEAMAEVRVSKGQADKAIAIYEKLSLYNPEKSAYFAQKIADLKNN